MKYFDDLVRSMTYLAQHEKTIFLGQSIAYPGHALFKTLAHVPEEKRLELPVAEEFQMGFSTGLALEGFVPVTFYPRWDFLILATNQLVNHLDKTPLISDGKMRPRVIIRTAVGSVHPLYPGVQHSQNHTEAFQKMLNTVEVVELQEPEQIYPEFVRALTREDSRSTLFVEYGDYYTEK